MRLTPAHATKKRRFAYEYCGCAVCRAALAPCPLTVAEHEAAMNADWTKCKVMR